MAIRLFIRDHIAFFIFEIVLILFVLSIFWLEGFRTVNIAIYVLAMSILLITSFLAVRYMLRRKFYAKIVALPSSMEDALNKSAKTKENIMVEQYMHELYRLYQIEVQSLYAKEQRHSKFLNQWIHQMKTPISVLELLLQEETVDKRSVQEELDRLKRGLEMVLMNARLDNFESDMQIEQIQLKDCVTAVINENKRLFITNRVFPQVSIDDNIIVASDSKWLKFIIGQFITNAVKYTFEENKKIEVKASVFQQKVILQIIDEGIGIPKSDLSRVTKPFFTGENGRKSGESTGMGLYLAKEVCEKLGHDFTIESEVGKGTTITLTFG